MTRESRSIWTAKTLRLFSYLDFEDNGVAGALIETQDGVLAIRARENLVIGTRDFKAERTHPLVSATEPVTANVCVVSKPASRFGELRDSHRDRR